MATCSVCFCNFPSIRSLFLHLKFAHGNVPDSDLYKCGETAYQRVFDTKNSFRKHLRNYHELPFVPDGSNIPNPNNPNIQRPQHLENIPLDEIVPENPNEPDLDGINPCDFDAALDADALQLVSKLYAKRRFPLNAAESILEDFQKFLGGGHLSILIAKVSSALSRAECVDDEKEEILSMFAHLEQPFETLRSDYRQIRRLEEDGYYIAPESYIIDRSFAAKSTRQGRQGKMVSLTGQYIPLRWVLKKFFELPGALLTMLAYMDSLMANDSEVIGNYIQSKHWAEKRSRFNKNVIVVPVNCSCDDVNVNNPLGSHVCKVVTMYASIPCLPPECCSLLDNHFLVLIYESYLRGDKLQEVYRPVIDELTFLETEGIEIQTAEGPKRVFFLLGLLQGDNLGLHGMLGLVESFSANYYCRFCTMHKSECTNSFVLRPELARTIESYERDLLSNNSVVNSGIKEPCPFNVIPSFHAMSNFVLDEMHDFREGIAHFDMVHILNNLTEGEHREFDLLFFNERIRMFDYGPIDGRNKPNMIRENDLRTSKKLRMTASEMTCLVLRLGVIVGDLVNNRDNPYWKLYLLLREIFDFTLAKKITKDSIAAFETLIADHNRFRLEECKLSGKPKLHFGLHVPQVCSEIGPLVHVSSMRHEAKHTHLTAPASGTRSRVNIALTLARKHQLAMAYRLLKNDRIIPPTKISNKFKRLRVNELEYPIPLELMEYDNLKCFKWIEYKGTVFQRKMVVITGTKELHLMFGEIEEIICGELHEPFIVCKRLHNIGFNDHVWAYQVERTNEQLCIKITDLYDPLPVGLHIMATGELYIGLRHGV